MQPEYNGETLTELPMSLAGRVFRSPMPYSHSYDPDAHIIALYHQAQVKTVVVLAEADEFLNKTGLHMLDFYHSEGLHVIHLPVPDFGVPPHPDELSKAIDAAIECAQRGENIAVHCHAGIGRTGVFTACMARRVLNLDGDEAIDWIRKVVPGAVENWKQMNFVRSFGE